MKAQELRDLSVDELAAKEQEFREVEFNLRFKHATGQLEKTDRLKRLRRDIARVKTIMKERGASE